MNRPTDHRGHAGPAVPSAVSPCLVAALLAVPVLAVYWQVGGHAFINFDDDRIISGNRHVLQGLTRESISWAFTTFHVSNWHPLTWLSHMLDVEMFGPSPGWHHRVNALFHLLNTELLFLVLWRMTGAFWRGAFVAALFAVHPLHVESVAWISERKDVLSTLFFLLAIGAYLRYVRRPDRGRYLLVMTLFALGLLCKPTLVTLPFVLLLLDFWPLRRLAAAGSGNAPAAGDAGAPLLRLVVEKIPMLGLSAASCVVTFLAQAGHGSVSDLVAYSPGLRIANAMVSYVAYLGKTLWPASLAAFYPHAGTVSGGIPGWKTAGAALLLSGLSLGALWQARRRPFLVVGWLWYLGMLVPMIGFVQVGSQALADRYTYVPLIGIFVAVVWGVPGLFAGWRLRGVAVPAVGAVSIVALSAAAWAQAGHWRDSRTVFSRAVAVTDRNWLALNHLGLAYEDVGRTQQAIPLFREALRIRPDYVEAWNNLGMSYDGLGEQQQAISCYREALRLRPAYDEAWNNLGVSYARIGLREQAISAYRESLRIRPDVAEAWNNLGLVYTEIGQPHTAIPYYREALRISPDLAVAWANLGAALTRLGQAEEAAACYAEARRLDSNNPTPARGE